MPHADPPKIVDPPKVKTGVYLGSGFYLTLRIFLLQKRPRMSYSQYGEMAIREKFERDTAQKPKGP